MAFSSMVPRVLLDVEEDVQFNNVTTEEKVSVTRTSEDNQPLVHLQGETLLDDVYEIEVAAKSTGLEYRPKPKFNVVFVLDNSGSMQRRIDSQTDAIKGQRRLDYLINDVNTFAKKILGYQESTVSAVNFYNSGKSDVIFSGATTPKQVEAAMVEGTGKLVTLGGTNISAGIIQAENVLDSLKTSQTNAFVGYHNVVVMMTDGQINSPQYTYPELDSLQSLVNAYSQRLSVYGVAYSTPNMDNDGTFSRFSNLWTSGNAGYGRGYMYEVNAQNKENMFDEIYQRISKVQTDEIMIDVTLPEGLDFVEETEQQPYTVDGNTLKAIISYPKDGVEHSFKYKVRINQEKVYEIYDKNVEREEIFAKIDHNFEYKFRLLNKEIVNESESSQEIFDYRKTNVVLDLPIYRLTTHAINGTIGHAHGVLGTVVENAGSKDIPVYVGRGASGTSGYWVDGYGPDPAIEGLEFVRSTIERPFQVDGNEMFTTDLGSHEVEGIFADTHIEVEWQKKETPPPTPIPDPKPDPTPDPTPDPVELPSIAVVELPSVATGMAAPDVTLLPMMWMAGGTAAVIVLKKWRDKKK